MAYLLKSSALLAVFYLCYMLFLQRETFFNANRWFLILGLFTSILFPLLVIPIYVEMPAASSGGFSMISTSVQTSPEPYFDLTTLLMWIYALGASFFLGRLLIQFFSLLTIIKTNDKKKIGKYTFVKSSQNITPFSFFKWIVFNPKLFNEEELKLILQHEKIHASQNHSIDTVLMDLATALFWFNPFIWLYRKALKQNLEFIADHYTQKQSQSNKRYQKLLLKTSLPEHDLIFINTFYNSTIRLKVFGKQVTLFPAFGQVKKRIVMLQKSKSNPMNTWKYSIILPLLVIFAMTFNTETIAQTSDNPKKIVKEDQQNILKFVVTKDTKDQQLDFIKEKLTEKGATISFKNVKRNTKNEITGIKVAYNHEHTKLVHSKKLSEPIEPFEISMNPSTGKIDMGEQTHGLSQTFKIETDEDGQVIISEPSNNSKENSFRIISNNTNKNSTNKDTIYIENTTGKVSYKNTIDENNKVISVKKTNNETYIFKENENPPLIFLDGKEIQNDEMDTIDPDSILNIQILKDKAATKKYGEKGEHGVILITSKKDGFSKTEDREIIIITTDENQKSNSTSNNGTRPLYLMDGKEISKDEMEAIDPKIIESVDVLKNEASTKKYGEKGKNGVVLITTKKK
ncbi:M56 family metallopeptidase [Gelidibacter sp.]|uniref:M56 family metallopeptidase n=1 Tax=Gelidibacter sp. TaxID=2018083 RepID=UPI002C093DEE|nr:M56 family metallopeptidase [Gelidibacter sp.]HUH29106.1 M56 family metallopeptidase [Gelidibacter sp.]